MTSAPICVLTKGTSAVHVKPSISKCRKISEATDIYSIHDMWKKAESFYSSLVFETVHFLRNLVGKKRGFSQRTYSMSILLDLQKMSSTVHEHGTRASAFPKQISQIYHAFQSKTYTYRMATNSGARKQQEGFPSGS